MGCGGEVGGDTLQRHSVLDCPPFISTPPSPSPPLVDSCRKGRGLKEEKEVFMGDKKSGHKEYVLKGFFR